MFLYHFLFACPPPAGTFLIHAAKIGERWRRFDLARTGKLVEAAKAHNKWTKRSGTIQAFNAIWPIPQTEINQNEDISQDDQNEGYK